MNRHLRLKHSFNWRMMLMRILVNMLALSFTALVVPQIYFVSRSLLAWLALAVGLGILNAVIKPVVQFLALRFIFVTVGLVLVVINAIILYMLSWLMPDQFAVDSLLWAVVGGLVLGLVSAFLENLLGLSPPIVSEKYPELRRRVQDRRFHRTVAARSQPGALSATAPAPGTATVTAPAVVTSAMPGADGETAAAATAALPEV